MRNLTVRAASLRNLGGIKLSKLTRCLLSGFASAALLLGMAISGSSAVHAAEPAPISALTCVSGASQGTQYMPSSYDLSGVPAAVQSVLAQYPNDNNYRVRVTDNGDGTTTYRVTLNGYFLVFKGAPTIMNTFSYVDEKGDTYRWVNTDPYQQYLLANSCTGKIKPVPTDIELTDNCSTGEDVLTVPANVNIYEMTVRLQFDGLPAQSYHVKVWGGYEVGWSGSGKLTLLNGKLVNPAYPTSLTFVDGQLILPAGTGNVFVELYGMKDSWWETNTYRVVVLNQSVSTAECEVPPLDGCTYTIGWYKNHTSQWPAGYDAADTFYNSGQTWLQVFNTPVKGNAYYILAPQFMAAKMTSAGAVTPAEMATALQRAEEILASSPATKPTKAAGAEMKQLATILDDYNNGRLGVAHCDA